VSYYLERVQRGIEHVEARLDEDLQLAEVSKAAGLSHWHFQRLFHALTGETLKTYVRSRRLAKSLERLLTTDLRVLDVALLAGFESQEAFARAFKQAFGMTPLRYRSLRDKSLFLKKPRFDAEYLAHLQTSVSLEPSIAAQPELELVGLRTFFYSVDSEKNNIGEQLPPLWQAFLARLEQIPGRVLGSCYGVVRQAEPDSDHLEYHAAVAVEPGSVPPPGMVSLQVPAATYARFTHRGEARLVNHTVSYAYASWLAGSPYRHTYGPDLEIYGAEYHPTRADSAFHYALPVTLGT
jgi:AraC family transcriptional regulator